MIERDYQKMLTYEQQQKYSNAIRQGYFNDYHGLAWRHTFWGAYIWKHPKRLKVLRWFEFLLGHRPEWEDITDDNLSDLKETLIDHYAPNSVRTICAEICALIRQNKATKNIASTGFAKALKTKADVSQSVFLTDDEIRRIHQFVARGNGYRFVKRMFMLECLTGARHSDCVNLSPLNIDEGGKTITYVSVKTKTEVTVPIHRWLKQYLLPSSPYEPKSMSNTAFNNALRKICDWVGIDSPVKIYAQGGSQSGPKYKFVSSHTGRRSFATNLAKKGVSIEQIAMMMGHMSGNMPNVQMTQKYIVGKPDLDYKVFRIFGTEEAQPEAMQKDLEYING